MFAKKKVYAYENSNGDKGIIMMQREFSMRNIQNGKLLKMIPLIIGTMDRTYLKWIM